MKTECIFPFDMSQCGFCIAKYKLISCPVEINIKGHKGWMRASGLGQCSIWRPKKKDFQCSQLLMCLILKCYPLTSPSSSFSSSYSSSFFLFFIIKIIIIATILVSGWGKLYIPSWWWEDRLGAVVYPTTELVKSLNFVFLMLWVTGLIYRPLPNSSLHWVLLPPIGDSKGSPWILCFWLHISHLDY